MMNKQEFTRIAKGIIKFQKGLSNHQIIHPTRDWVIGIFVGVIIFGVSAVWSATTYLKHENTTITSNGAGNTEAVVYREALVLSALEKFSEKKERLAGLVGVGEEITLEPEEAASDEEVVEVESAVEAEEEVVVEADEQPEEDVSGDSEGAEEDSGLKAPPEDIFLIPN